VSEAGSVAEALGLLVSAPPAPPPDWVLLDLMLPDGSGHDVLRRVRADGIASRVCVVSGCGPLMLDEVRELGARHVFTKPLDVDGLIRVLSN
jgi:DNA-binding response OmpR family regulator